MDTLGASPDSLLVSAETVKDYQLLPGDPVNLRLQDATSGQPITVAFRYVGIVNEFPTAPKDSFFVANASYVAAQTHSDAVGAFLVDTGGQDVTTVAEEVRSRLGGVASSLTAVDLAGLTRVELGFALVLAAAAGGLVLLLGLTERRRTFAIATVLGARRRELRGLIVAEVTVLAIGGLSAGAAVGWLLSQVLVAVLTGVFDPPPASMTVPWSYLAATALIATAALAFAAAGAIRQVGRPPMGVLREL
jgi:putative ABC transport system permease protein